PGTYTLRWTVTNGSCSAQDTVDITVNALPLATITTGGTTTFCAGTSVRLTANPAGGTYHWSTGDRTRSITVSAADTYSVDVTDGNGCPSQIIPSVTLYPAVAAVVSGGGTICAGGTAVIRADLSGTGPWTVLWSD